MTGSLQEKNGKYYAVLNVYVDGKRKPKWIDTGLSARGNKKAAERFLQTKIDEYENPINPEESILFCDYVTTWLGRIKKRVRPPTYKSYCDIAEKHVIPYFRDTGLLLLKAKRADMQRFLDAKWDTGNLSPRSIKYLATILKQVCREAVIDELIANTPCQFLDIPKQESRQPTFLTRKEVDTLLEATKDEQLYPIILVTLTYGLRRSEVLGLKWDSIDFENCTLTVKHTVVQNKEIFESDKTKNKTSHRTLLLLPEDLEMLSRIKSEEDECRELYGKSYVDNNYIFKQVDGTPFRPDFVTRKFKQLLKRYGIKEVRFHDLRHTCASLAVSNGVPLKFIQEQLGHSDIQTTANTYAHLDFEHKKEGSRAIYNTIRG